MADRDPKRPETLGGFVLHNVPFPRKLDGEALALLKTMAPIQFEQHYAVTYLHSYGQDSPFFAALANGVLLGSRDPESGTVYATPRGHGMETGRETDWVRLPEEGAVHAFTVCHFGSEEFLPETPFVLALIAFPGVDTLFLSRLDGVDPHHPSIDWIGMPVRARFLRNSKFKPTDVSFVPAGE